MAHSTVVMASSFRSISAGTSRSRVGGMTSFGPTMSSSPIVAANSSILASAASICSSAALTTSARELSKRTRCPSTPVTLPASRTPRSWSRRTSSERLSGAPTNCGAGDLASSAGSAGAMKPPIVSIHHRMSLPRYVRGSRVCRPTASVTCRPAAASSSASWTPVAEAPTTSTFPVGSWPGFR